MAGTGILAQRAPILLILIFLSISIGSCGGGSAGPSLDPSINANAGWPGHEWEPGAKAGSFIAVAVDETERRLDPLTENLDILVEKTRAGQRVVITASDLAPTDHAYLHLKYDARQVRPAAVAGDPSLKDRAVFIGITEVPGVVSMGLATSRWQGSSSAMDRSSKPAGASAQWPAPPLPTCTSTTP